MRTEHVFTRVPVVRRGNPIASANRLGQRIRLRHMPWVLVDAPGLGLVMIICVHMPPRRMHRSGLYWLYALTVRRLVRKARRNKWHCMVLGDWNKRKHEDPAGLEAAYGGCWEGGRIDHAWLSDGLKDHVRWRTLAHLSDDHEVVRFSIGDTLRVITINLNWGRRESAQQWWTAWCLKRAHVVATQELRFDYRAPLRYHPPSRVPTAVP